MSLKIFVIDCLKAQKLDRFDNLQNTVAKIQSGAVRDAGSIYAAKKNGLFNVSVSEAVRGYDNLESDTENGKRYGDDFYE